jgi:carbamoyltransferase
MTSKKMNELFGGPPRAMEGPLTQREMDIAASIQEVTEEVMLGAARYAHELTGLPFLVMAGGVALNCVGNGRILREGPFEKLWIQPAAGDAGGALGAALFVWYQLMDKERAPLAEGDRQKGSLLGPHYSGERIRSFLDASGAVYRYFDEESALVDEIARLIDSERVVEHMEGRMEFGPRALGSRSIIGDARSEKMQSVMNLKIKFRESFRPFAPSILRESVDEYFEMRPQEDSPYMLLVAPVRDEKWLAVSENGFGGLDKLKQKRSVVPAITHANYSARVQTVDADRHPRFHRILDSLNDRAVSGRDQYELQRAGGADRVHTRRRLSVLHGDEHGRAGDRQLFALERGAAARRAPRIGRVPRAVPARLDDTMLAQLNLRPTRNN